MSSIVICTGGPQQPLNKQNWALARTLAPHHRVLLIVDRCRTDLVGHREGFEVRTWPSARPTRWRDALFFSRVIADCRPDVILANFSSVNIAMVVGWLRRVPMRVAWYRTLSRQILADHASVPRWRRWALTKRKALVYRMATHVVPVSDAAREDVTAVYGVSPAKCRVIRTCRADPREDVGVPPPAKADGLRLVCVGRLERSKGQDVLIRALGRLVEREPEWPVSLELVGDGPERAAYAALAAECGVDRRVTFAGAVPHQDALRRMAMAHVAVAPFRTDAGPGAIVEALGLSLPLVVTASGGMREQVGDSGCALAVPPEDPVALADALWRVLGDPALAADMAAAGRARFVSTFHLDHWLAGVSQWIASQRSHA